MGQLSNSYEFAYKDHLQELPKSNVLNQEGYERPISMKRR